LFTGGHISTPVSFHGVLELTHGTVKVGDLVQVQGSQPPIIGTVTQMWWDRGIHSGQATESVTKRGPLPISLCFHLNGIADTEVQFGTALVAAPPGSVPCPSPGLEGFVPVTSASSVGPAQPSSIMADSPAFAQQLLHQAQASPTRMSYSFTSTVTINGQPVTTWDQTAVDAVGPVMLGMGPDPQAVAGVLRDRCGMAGGMTQAYFATLPAPLPNNESMPETQADALVSELRQAGADVLTPGPGAMFRMIARLR